MSGSKKTPWNAQEKLRMIDKIICIRFGISSVEILQRNKKIYLE